MKMFYNLIAMLVLCCLLSVNSGQTFPSSDSGSYSYEETEWEPSLEYKLRSSCRSCLNTFKKFEWTDTEGFTCRDPRKQRAKSTLLILQRCFYEDCSDLEWPIPPEQFTIDNNDCSNLLHIHQLHPLAAQIATPMRRSAECVKNATKLFDVYQCYYYFN